MSLTHEQRERLPETLAKATAGPWAQEDGCRYPAIYAEDKNGVEWTICETQPPIHLVCADPDELAEAVTSQIEANADLIALAPAMAETIIEDGKTIAAMREALADTRAELELLRGGETCDHSVGVCWCDHHRLVSRIDAILNNGAQS